MQFGKTKVACRGVWRWCFCVQYLQQQRGCCGLSVGWFQVFLAVLHVSASCVLQSHSLSVLVRLIGGSRFIPEREQTRQVPDMKITSTVVASTYYT